MIYKSLSIATRSCVKIFLQNQNKAAIIHIYIWHQFLFLPLCSQVLFCGNNLGWVCAFAFKEANNGVYCQAMLDYITNNIFPRYNTRWKRRTFNEKKGWFWQKEEKLIWLRACLEGLSFCCLQQSNFTGSVQPIKTV